MLTLKAHTDWNDRIGQFMDLTRGAHRPMLRPAVSRGCVIGRSMGTGMAHIYDGVALTVLGDTVLTLWKGGARVHRSRWVYDLLDDATMPAPEGILVLMVILPTSEPPDHATRVENTRRLRRLQPSVRRLVTVPLGDGLRFIIVRSVVRGMAVTGGWSGKHFVEARLERGVARLLHGAGPSSPTATEVDRALLAEFSALGLDADVWLRDGVCSGASEAVPPKLRPQRVGHAAHVPPELETDPRQVSGVFGKGAPDLADGSLELTSKLRLRHRLGRGGMGVLWVAEHRGLQCDVVVKFLREGETAQASERVAREAASAVRVRSPHVVQVLDHGVSAAGLPFLVMECLEGCDLREYLERRRRLSCREVATIVYQLAGALAKLHAAGLLHGDVKPPNVFLCAGEDLFVKLLDFGLARRFDHARAAPQPPSARPGTLPYMSPEQVAGGALDGRSDVWSLGVLAFECLTGVRPFDGESGGAVRLAIETLPIPRPSTSCAALPAGFDVWFATACARTPLDRFPSVVDAADALSNALDVHVRSERFDYPGDTDLRPEAMLDFGGTRTG